MILCLALPLPLSVTSPDSFSSALVIAPSPQADATCEAASDTRTSIVFTKVAITLGPFTFPLPQRETSKTKTGTLPGYIDWLYLDENIRITRGSKGSLFVHKRDKMGADMGVLPTEASSEAQQATLLADTTEAVAEE